MRPGNPKTAARLGDTEWKEAVIKRRRFSFALKNQKQIPGK
jgi:hypothetical protein